MERLKQFAFQRPVWFSALLILISVALTELPLEQVLATVMDERLSRYIAWATMQFTASLGLLALARYLGLWAGLGFTTPRRWKDLWVLWPLALLTLLNASDWLAGQLVIDTSRPVHILFFALFYLSVGIFEELLGRGVVLMLMVRAWGDRPRGMYRAVLASSGLFALGHIANMLMGRYSVLAGMAQIVFSLFFAVFFAACMLRNRTIVPVMLMHAVFDFAGALEEIAVGGGLFEHTYVVTWSSALTSVLITLPLFVYGMFLLRKVQHAQPPWHP